MSQIRYKDIIDLGFNEDFSPSDKVYQDQYGYDYVIITKKLTKRIYLDWQKETRICELVRTDKEGNVKSRLVMSDLKSIKDMINFYSD